MRSMIGGLPHGLLIATLCLAATPGAAQTPQPFRSLKEIRERGVVMQQWESSCAAAAAATVLTYGFHDPVSERHAASRMLVNTTPGKVKARGGFSLLDMQRFVEGRGYRGSAYRYLGLDDLRVFHAPIVPINEQGYNHYVVFNGIKDDQVLLADPAFGNRTLSIAAFTRVWMQGLAFVVTRPPSPRATP